MRVLIAEDETIIRLDLRQLLERAGHEVVGEARDGQEAVTLAASLAPELILMDVKMPRQGGIEAAREITAARPVPIVMLTAYSQEDLVRRASEAGAYGYLVKPFRESTCCRPSPRRAPGSTSCRRSARRRPPWPRRSPTARRSSGPRAC
jgi:response regulator NasT